VFATDVAVAWSPQTHDGQWTGSGVPIYLMLA